MLSPMTVLKSKVGLDGNLLCGLLDIDPADLYAYENGRKHIPSELLNRMRKLGFIGDLEKFCNDQIEFMGQKVAIAQGAQRIGKPVVDMTELDELIALTEAQDQPVRTYEDPAFIIRYVKNDGSYY